MIVPTRNKLLSVYVLYYARNATLMIYELSRTYVLPLTIEPLHSPAAARSFEIAPS